MDQNSHTPYDYETELIGEDPDKVSRFSGSSTHTIDRIEREAAANLRFLHLLGGVWYNTAPEPLKARLHAILQGRHW